MPRSKRICPGGTVFHCLNRAVARLTLFEKPEDYQAFERVLEESRERVPLRILSYTVMPNHWHLVLWPHSDDQVSQFLRYLTVTHTMRWHAHFQTSGTGHLYQGRFKSFPVQSDRHLLAVIRYVERDPLRARLVKQADAWPWGSLWRRTHGNAQARRLLTAWPIRRPAGWLDHVNTPQSEGELEALRQSTLRGTPYGEATWQRSTATALDLNSTLRRRGRPKRKET